VDFPNDPMIRDLRELIQDCKPPGRRPSVEQKAQYLILKERIGKAIRVRKGEIEREERLRKEEFAKKGRFCVLAEARKLCTSDVAKLCLGLLLDLLFRKDFLASDLQTIHRYLHDYTGPKPKSDTKLGSFRSP